MNFLANIFSPRKENTYIVDCTKKVNCTTDECKQRYNDLCQTTPHDNSVDMFFIELNKKLKDSEICFVSGSYVFEGIEIFDFLIKSNHTKGVRMGQKVFGKKFISPKSHNLHINNDIFKKHKAFDSSSKLYNKKESSTKNGFSTISDYRKIEDHIGFQYEIDLGENGILYPCDNECNTLMENERTMLKKNIEPEIFVNHQFTKMKCDYNKEYKKCILFYVFAVEYEDIIYLYTFVKLETMPTINLVDAAKHTKHAYNHYFTKDGASRKNLYTQRREDHLEFPDGKLYKLSQVYRKDDKFLIIKGESQTAVDAYIFGKKDENAYIKLGRTEKDLEAIKYYNSYVRTRNELFLPKTIVNNIFNNLNKKLGGSKKRKFIKTDKRHNYNNYDYVVYKLNNKRYIRLQSKFTNIGSLPKPCIHNKK